MAYVHLNKKNIFSAEHSGHSINRTKLLRVLLNGKVECKKCEHRFRSGIMDRLHVSDWVVTVLPEKLTIELECGFCKHQGVFSMEPNPFMDDKNIKKYAYLVTA